MIPKMPIKIAFDPTGKDWWKHEETRRLILLWKPCHITSQYFWDDALRSGKRIAERQPKTAQELAHCLVGQDFQAVPMFQREDNKGDAWRFAEEALPYFTGEKSVEYEIIKEGP